MMNQRMLASHAPFSPKPPTHMIAPSPTSAGTQLGSTAQPPPPLATATAACRCRPPKPVPRPPHLSCASCWLAPLSACCASASSPCARASERRSPSASAPARARATCRSPRPLRRATVSSRERSRREPSSCAARTSASRRALSRSASCFTRSSSAAASARAWVGVCVWRGWWCIAWVCGGRRAGGCWGRERAVQQLGHALMSGRAIRVRRATCITLGYGDARAARMRGSGWRPTPGTPARPAPPLPGL